MKKTLKAQALTIMIIVVGVSLMITLAFMSITTREIVVQRGLSDSITAYYAAETGVEQAALQVKGNLGSMGSAQVNPGNLSFSSSDYYCGSNATHDNKTFDTATDPSKATITCVGKKNGVMRAIQATFDANSGTKCDSNTGTTEKCIFPIPMKEVNP